MGTFAVADGGEVKGLIEAVTALAQVLIRSYGPWGSLSIVIVAIVLSFAYRVYQDRRKDQEVNAVIAEKERIIQRMANIERDLRVQLFKALGYTVDEIERLVIRADFDDPVSSRRALESGREPPSNRWTKRRERPR